MLKLTFLGTSAGVPTKQRNVTGLGVSLINPYSTTKDTPWLLIDCGEGTQHQILHTPLSLQQLRAICITHVHGDHCYGLAGLLASMSMNGRKQPLTLIAPQAIGNLLDSLTLHTELYFNFNIDFISLESLSLTNQRFKAVDLSLSDSHQLTIEPFALSHRVASHAFKICQTLHTVQLDTAKLQAMGVPPSAVWGKLQHGYDVTLEDGRTLLAKDLTEAISPTTAIIVAGDNDTPSLLREACQGVSLLVHEATYTQAIADKIAQRGDGFDPQHSSAKQVASFAQSVGLPNLILTHFSGRFQPFDKPSHTTLNMGHLREEVGSFYQGKFWLANDFDEFEVQQTRVKRKTTNR
ncbi:MULTISPECIES: ribonuclease Z [unclassified Moraxella]|uniref:ribonuclease Z n=1 Tax=unclassified Moraxella TaxID=2685852 RepID=UPI003AF832FD